MHIDTGTTIMPVSCNINGADKILKDYAGSCILSLWSIEIVILISVLNLVSESKELGVESG